MVLRRREGNQPLWTTAARWIPFTKLAAIVENNEVHEVSEADERTTLNTEEETDRYICICTPTEMPHFVVKMFAVGKCLNGCIFDATECVLVAMLLLLQGRILGLLSSSTCMQQALPCESWPV